MPEDRGTVQSYEVVGVGGLKSVHAEMSRWNSFVCLIVARSKDVRLGGIDSE